MIKNTQRVIINAEPAVVYDYIDHMPNKFPTFKILETRFLVAIRTILIGETKTGLRIFANKSFFRELNKAKNSPMKLGGTFGPFTLIETEKPSRYIFSLKTLVFDFETGYVLEWAGAQTELKFELVSTKDGLAQTLYWPFIKIQHHFLAHNALKTIKQGIARSES